MYNFSITGGYIMDDVNLSIAINILNKKIADLNVKIAKENNKKLEDDLNKLLEIKKEIYKGDKSLVKYVIDDVKRK